MGQFEHQTSQAPKATLETKKLVDATLMEPPEKRVAKLIESGVLTNLEGYSWGKLKLVGGSRFFVFANINGVPVPIYKTRFHSSGKRSDQKFFPFFGVVPQGDNHERDWVIKGTIEEINSFYGIPELQKVSLLLTKVFDFHAELGYSFEGREVSDISLLNNLLKSKFDFDFTNINQNYRDFMNKVIGEIRK